MKPVKTTSTLDIGQVAKAAGLPVSTLRFYEQKGLIRSLGRNGLRRVFPLQVLAQLEFIALGKSGGFSLEEIAAMFTADGQFRVDRKRLLAKAGAVDRSIQRLQAIRDGLRHVAECKAPRHFECPKFQRLLRIAGKSQARKKGAAS
jgi:DNA-binding transcriptional MerR regulator